MSLRYPRPVTILIGLLLVAGYAGAQPAVLINEILFQPSGPDSTREWVELYNPGAVPQWLDGWSLANAAGEPIGILPPVELPPACFLVIGFGPGADDLDFSDGGGAIYTGAHAPVLDNQADACALYAGPPLASPMVDFVAWSAVGLAPTGPVVLDAVAQGQWPGPDSFFDVSFTGPCFVAPWTDDQGESIGRDRFAGDSNLPDDWCDHGGQDAYASTEGRANFGPPFRAGELIPLAQWSVNQFLWEFAYDVVGASHVPIAWVEGDTEAQMLATHTIEATSRLDGLLKTFSGDIDCHWLQTGVDSWQVEVVGLLTSGDGPEALEFQCTSSEAAPQTGLSATSWRNATITYVTPLGLLASSNLTYTTTATWTTPIELIVDDQRHVNDSRGVDLMRSTSGQRMFPDDAHEDLHLLAETTFAAPAGAPTEIFEVAASKVHLAAGGVLGTLHVWRLDTGEVLHLAGPGSFQVTVINPDSLVFQQNMHVGNEGLGYRAVELRGYHGGRELPGGEYCFWGRDEVEVEGQPIAVISSYVDGPWWKRALRIVSATAWGVGCFAGTVVGSPTVVGAGVAVGACAAGGISSDILIEELCPEDKGGPLARQGDLPPMLLDFPRLVCAPPTAAPAAAAALELRLGPNPGGGTTAIRYALPRTEVVALAVYDAAGRRVRLLQPAAARSAGPHALAWDGRDDGGRPVPAGTYLCRLTTATDQRVAKVVLLR